MPQEEKHPMKSKFGWRWTSNNPPTASNELPRELLDKLTGEWHRTHGCVYYPTREAALEALERAKKEDKPRE